MKNKTGTAAGNPRARADRASPAANGNPNAQVGSFVCCYPSSSRSLASSKLFHHPLLSFSTAYHSSVSQPRRPLYHGSNVYAFFFHSRLCGAGACALPGLSARFWVLGLRPRPRPWPCPGAGAGAGANAVQWAAPQQFHPTLPPGFSEVWASHPCSSHHWTQRHAFPVSMSHNCL